MSQLYIPHLGDKLKLTYSWSFTLHPERRNEKFISKIYGKQILCSYRPRCTKRWSFTDGTSYQGSLEILPKDTVLIVDRIYIRTGSPDFDSVTFRVASCPNTRLNKGRFWVKLDDANTIHFEKV